MTPLKFASVGFEHIVCTNRVVAIINPTTSCGKKNLKGAKERNTYIDCCLGKSLKSLLLLDDGRVMGSHISPKTLTLRFNGEKQEANEADEDD